MPAHVKHWFFISREIWALSYNAFSSFGNELNPETNLAAFSLNIANNTPHIIKCFPLKIQAFQPLLSQWTSLCYEQFDVSDTEIADEGYTK